MENTKKLGTLYISGDIVLKQHHHQPEQGCLVEGGINNMAEVVKLGSLYLDGQPKKAGTFCINNQISLGSTVLDYELQWVS